MIVRTTIGSDGLLTLLSFCKGICLSSLARKPWSFFG